MVLTKFYSTKLRHKDYLLNREDKREKINIKFNICIIKHIEINLSYLFKRY